LDYEHALEQFAIAKNDSRMPKVSELQNVRILQKATSFNSQKTPPRPGDMMIPFCHHKYRFSKLGPN
jgi:hypothetical protein